MDFFLLVCFEIVPWCTPCSLSFYGLSADGLYAGSLTLFRCRVSQTCTVFLHLTCVSHLRPRTLRLWSPPCTRVSLTALQALASRQQQLSADSALLEQQLAAAAAGRLELVRLKADLLECIGSFFGALQQQRQAEVEVINKTATEVSISGNCTGNYQGVKA